MAALNAGITLPGEGDRGTVWKILGQTYYLKEVCDTSFAFEVVGVDLNATISRQIRE